MQHLQPRATMILLVIAFLPLNFTIGFRAPKLQQLNRVTMRSSLGSNIEDLENVHRRKQSRIISDPVDIGRVSYHNKKRPSHTKERPPVNDIIAKPIHSLNTQELKSLCNSIRRVENGSSSRSLVVLERILLELDHLHDTNADEGNQSNTAILKPIHVFSVLTSISKDVRLSRERSKMKNGSGASLDARGIERLKNVVVLLRQLVRKKNSVFCERGCYKEDVVSFATMISADVSQWEKSGVDAAIYFLRLIENESSDNEWDPRLIGAVLNAFANWGRAEEAKDLLEEVMGVKIAQTDADERSSDTPTKRLDISQAGPCFGVLLRAISKNATLHSQKQHNLASIDESKIVLAKGRDILLHHMPSHKVAITNRTCSALLQGYSELGLGEDAEKLLIELEMLFQTSKFSAPPEGQLLCSLDTACYNTVISAYCRSRQEDDVLHAEEIFNSMVDQQPIPMSDANILPPRADFVSYSTLLNGYCNNGEIDKAEILLESIRSSPVPKSIVGCYSSVIHALSKSDHVDAPERIMSLIQVMEQMHAEDRKYPLPNRATFISGLRCMSKLGRGNEANLLLRKLRNTLPWSQSWSDIQAYTLALRAWGWTNQVNREDAARHAEMLFNELQAQVNEGHLAPLDVHIFNNLLNCYAKAGMVDKAEALVSEMTGTEPNGISYSLIIKALSNSKAPDAVPRAWAILESLGYRRDGSDSTLSPVFKVSIAPLNSMLKFLAKRGLASEAEALLESIDDLVLEGKLEYGPDVSSYEAVLEALGKCNDPDIVQRAESLVTRMEVSAEMGGNFPSLLAYNNLINCYGNLGVAGKAQRLYERLNDGIVPVKPDEYTLGSTLKAIVNSGKSRESGLASVKALVNASKEGDSIDNKVISAHRLRLYAKWGMADEAEELLRQMKSPSVIHYTIVLNALAKLEDEKASDRAEKLFDKMSNNSDFAIDIAAYHGLLLNYSLRGQVDKAEKLVETIIQQAVTPNRQTFTMLVNAYSNTKKCGNASQRAEEILDKMRELHAAGNKDAEPDNVALASIIRCIRNGKVKNMTAYEKLELMSRLQLGTWPFDKH